jgi:hypothetical protein
MLDKFLIHIKNIIFFKAIIYLLITILFLTIIPIIQNDLEKSLVQKEKAKIFLNQAMLKLDSIVDFEDKIVETNKTYQSLVKYTQQSECWRKNELFDKINMIATNHQLFDPIHINISRFFNHDGTKHSSGTLEIREDILELNFNIPDTESFISVGRDIINILPLGSIVIFAEIIYDQTLSPLIIEKLSKYKKPDLLKAKLKIKLREIVYEN